MPKKSNKITVFYARCVVSPVESTGLNNIEVAVGLGQVRPECISRRHVNCGESTNVYSRSTSKPSSQKVGKVSEPRETGE